jgi:L-gulonate 5-dehydrogenase
MKAAVTLAPGQIEVVDRPEPRPARGEVLIRVERVGICGSDLHLYHGNHPYASYPRVQGHEFSGTVVAYGEGDPESVAIGERVAIEPLISCGECYPCRQARPNCCARLLVMGAHRDGAMVELMVVPADRIYRTGELDAELAALVEPVSIGVQAAARGQIGAAEQVLIFGAGPIGLATMVAALDRGARVMMVDRLPNRLALARALGAERTVEVGRDDAHEAALEWTGGDGPAVTVDAVGAPAVIRACVDLVAGAGRVVVIGLSDQEVSLPIIQFSRKELTIVGSRNNAGRFGEAVALVRKRRHDIRSLVTHRFPLSRVAEAFAVADRQQAVATKVMVEVA